MHDVVTFRNIVYAVQMYSPAGGLWVMILAAHKLELHCQYRLWRGHKQLPEPLCSQGLISPWFMNPHESALSGMFNAQRCIYLAMVIPI